MRRLYDATGVAQGGELQVNTTTAGDQQYSSVALDSAGNFVIAWASTGQDGSGWGVYGQRFNAAGAQQGAEFQINTTTAGDQLFPRVAMDAAGKFTVAWSSSGQDNGSSTGIYLRSYDSSGTAETGELLVNTTTSGDQQNPSIAHTSGRWIVAWSGSGAGDSDGVFMRQYNDGMNAAPVNTVPGAQTTNEDTPLVFSNGNAIGVNDADAGTSTVQVSLTVSDFAQGFESDNAGWDYSTVEPAVFAAQRDAAASPRARMASRRPSDPITPKPDSTTWPVAAARLPRSLPSVRRVIRRSFRVVVTPRQSTSILMSPEATPTIHGSTIRRPSAARRSAAMGCRPRDATSCSTPATTTIPTPLAAVRRFVIAGSNNAGRPSTGPKDASNDPLTITTSGWYTFEHHFYDSGGGVLAVDMVLKDASGAVLQTWTRSNPTDIIGSTVGGSRESQFASQEFSFLAFDNAVKTSAPGNALAGTLTLGSTAGLTFSSGDGTRDAAMTFSGTLTDVNNALAGLTFSPAANFNGVTSLQMVTNDLGNSGLGGAKTDTDNIAISVNSVNDAPFANHDGNALSFDGTDDYVGVTGNASLQMTSTVTLEAWVKPTTSANGTLMIINKEGEYEVALSSSGEVKWAFASTTPGWGWHGTGAVVPLDQWSHVAVTYNNGVVNTYINGTLVETYSGSGTIGDAHPGLNDLRIGGRSNSPTGQFFQGQIDDVRVWNVERTAAEILADLSAQLTGSETGLVGYWTFDETSGNAIVDGSTQGNNGVLGDGVAGQMPRAPARIQRTKTRC